MSKDKEITLKDKESKDIDKDKILRELVEKLKSQGEEFSNKNGSDEDIDKELNSNLEEEKGKQKNQQKEKINEIRFNEFIHSLHTLKSLEDVKAPVLENIASEQPRPVFVRQGTQTTRTSSEENNNDFKYAAGQESSSDAKYIQNYEKSGVAPEHVDITHAGRDTSPFRQDFNQQAFFQQSSTLRQMDFESPTIEKVRNPERIDTQNIGRENPFEQDKREIKYDKK